MKKIFFTVLFIALIGYFAFALYSYGEERKNEIIIDVAEAVLDGTNEDRYQNMLIYYDTEFDRNEYGYELLVDAGNGFVIGKGDKVTWVVVVACLVGFPHLYAVDVYAR